MQSAFDRAESWLPRKTAIFHEQAVFCGLWVLVVLVGVHTLTKLRSILEPLIWAVFLMMALLPLTDLIECAVLRLFAAIPSVLFCGCGASRNELRAEADSLERQYSGLTHVATDRSRRSERERPAFATAEPEASGSAGQEDSGSSDSETKSLREEEEEGGCGLARMIAVLVTIALFLGMVMLFGLMIYQSAAHMESVMPHYREGAERLLDRLSDLKDQLPKKVADQVATKCLASIEEFLKFLLSTIFEHVTSMLVEMLMTLLYMVFWLCQPVFIGETVTALFKRYILLKTFTSSMYAFCIYVLLLMLEVDLAIVFGLIAFVFNFVPEVGTIVAMILPLPVILFDGRLERPFLNLAIALVGQFCLKFVFANIIEVKLVERQHDFRMHPVTILFFLAFFGSIWGATGMLISVPLMAAVKAFAQVMPAAYRDPILVFLEGDKHAPDRLREES
mmetsp:Transcript_101404/g.262562  ORF Transcript_101404/g.262562 Transcript_101404/m.262562 type:complete len:449 (+) Transcript_101404:40-1386(+)